MSATRRLVQTSATLFEAATAGVNVNTITLEADPAWLRALEARRARGLRLRDERARWNGSRRSR